MRVSSRAWFLRGFVVALLAVAWTVGFLPSPAFAACDDEKSAWIVKTEGVANNQYGVKVGQNLVVNPASDCGIVRSIYIKDSNINTVEVGWFEDDGTGGFHYKDCQDFANPHVLVYALIDNTPICKQDPQPVFASEPDYSFKVVNADHDSDFAYYYDDDDTPDTLLSVITTNHTNGCADGH